MLKLEVKRRRVLELAKFLLFLTALQPVADYTSRSSVPITTHRFEMVW